MMFRFLGAFLLMYILGILAQSTVEHYQEKGPNTSSGKSKGMLIVFKSKIKTNVCLGSRWDSVKKAVEVFYCDNGTDSLMAFTQFRYGNEGVFLIKQYNDQNLCHQVEEDSTSPTCARAIRLDKTCDVSNKGQRFWFEAYGDEVLGWGIVRSELNISDDCSREGPPSLHLKYGQGTESELVAVHLAPATDNKKDDVLWKIKKWECRKTP